eukprot:2263614-Pleurochrysis_carterae.AAC.3
MSMAELESAHAPTLPLSSSSMISRLLFACASALPARASRAARMLRVAFSSSSRISDVAWSQSKRSRSPLPAVSCSQ